MRFCIYVVMVVLPISMFAQQEGSQKTEKRQPESRPADVQQPTPRETPLPTIQLPEFVITGSASINPPDAQKSPYDEDGIYKRLSSENSAGTRERETLDLGERFKQSLLLPVNGVSGNVRAGIGNYFTPEIGVSVGLTDPSYDATATASYWRSKGFMRNSDASSGMISVQGSHEILTGSSSVQQARLTGAAGFDVRSYKFYGSLVPSTRRDLSRFNLLVQAAADLGVDASLRTGVRFQTMSVKDSSTTTTENSVRVDLSGSVPVLDFPLDVGGRAWFSTVTTLSSRQLSLISLSVGTSRLSWGDVSLHAGAEGHHIEGMNGQSGSYFFPYVFLDVGILKQHNMFLSFRPAPLFQTLEDHLNRLYYISAGASIRHTIARLALTGGMESDWNSWLSTSIWLEFRSMTDYPLYADSSGTGVWLLAYGGKTTVTAYHLDGVANIRSNDYFAVKSVARLSRSTVVRHIPYLPEFEGSVFWTHRFGSDFELSTSVGVVSSQDVDFVGSSSVGGHVWTGLKVVYLGFADLRIFAEATNMANQNYERWKGYRAEPFRISAGLMYRW